MRRQILYWIDDACERAVAARKGALLANAAGEVLEIGPGRGVNFRYYPSGVRWRGIEPDRLCHEPILRAARHHGIQADLLADPESLRQLPEGSVDVVVETFALCTVPDPAATLADVLRVLKPGGSLLFMEHVIGAPGSLLRQAQRAVQPLWGWFAGGCHLDRDPMPALSAAGFASVTCEAFEIDVPMFGPHIAGIARKRT